jgi:hypothetical protein
MSEGTGVGGLTAYLAADLEDRMARQLNYRPRVVLAFEDQHGPFQHGSEIAIRDEMDRRVLRWLRAKGVRADMTP